MKNCNYCLWIPAPPSIWKHTVQLQMILFTPDQMTDKHDDGDDDDDDADSGVSINASCRIWRVSCHLHWPQIEHSVTFAHCVCYKAQDTLYWVFYTWYTINPKVYFTRQRIHYEPHCVLLSVTVLKHCKGHSIQDTVHFVFYTWCITVHFRVYFSRQRIHDTLHCVFYTL